MSYTGTGNSGKVYTASGVGQSPTFVDIGTSSGLTDRGVVVAKGSSAFQATSAGTNGQVLIGSSLGNPAFGTIGSTDGSIGFTSGSNSLNMTVNATATFPLCTTPYAVVCGGASTAAVFQQVASVGTSGQVLTSNGAGALPTFQAAGGGAGLFPYLNLNATDYYSMSAFCQSAGPISVSHNFAYMTPFHFTKTINLTKLGVYVSVAVAGSVARVGIYSMNQSTGAFTLVLDGGTVSCASTGMSVASVSATLTAGTAYMAIVTVDENGGAVQIMGCTLPLYFGWYQTGFVNGYTKGGVVAGSAFPASYLLSDFNRSASNAPMLFYQTS